MFYEIFKQKIVAGVTVGDLSYEYETILPRHPILVDFPC